MAVASFSHCSSQLIKSMKQYTLLLASERDKRQLPKYHIFLLSIAIGTPKRKGFASMSAAAAGKKI